MNAVVALIRDVFRQARATRLEAVLFAVTALATLVCLTAHFTPTSDSTGNLTILFGSIAVIDGVPRDVAVRYFQFLLAGIIADTLGVLLALVWTAGFLPTFLDHGASSVLVAKPVSRAVMFFARYFGVVMFVGLQACLFVAATALAIGLRLGVWETGYWLAAPLLVVQFVVFYAFSALVAVMTRSTAASVIASILFWMVCWSMNYARHALVGLDLSQATEAMVRTADWSYWFMPKPADFGLVLYDVLDADRFVTPWIEFRRVQERGLFHPGWSVISSLIFAAVLLFVAAYEFVHDDY